MSKVKHEKIYYTYGIELAGTAMHMFYSSGIDYNGLLYEFEELVPTLAKPNKITLLHRYLEGFCNISEELESLANNIDDPIYIYNYINRLVTELNSEKDIPEMYDCDDENHCNCNCWETVRECIKFIQTKNDILNKEIVHAAFQIAFLDRKFLHDFHLEFSDYIKENSEMLESSFVSNFTQKNGFKRAFFPAWLKKAVFHRDKGCCSNCNRDLTSLYNLNGVIHIDHIIPLKLYGNNDPTNFQILCETCNTSKGDRNTSTSISCVPFWNLEKN